MKSTEYEKFQQCIFDEIEGLGQVEREHIIASFIEIGQRAHVDVVTEILDKGKSVPEVFQAILKALPPI